ncbi:MAG: tetratricopeptide repeat protein [Acidobacteria bacterium]|nr:tetratricopeptide repeat protein [Acidobacteriota bacterium]
MAGQTQAPPGQPEATSLLGHPLYAPPLSSEQRARLEENLGRARAEFEKNPDDPHALIWLGRRTAYLGRFREAISLYSQGIEKHPDDARLYRHCGHRYITVRELDLAIADLERAARLVEGQPDEVEPDGQPNPQNIPRSTLQTNIFYHLGLAYYLKGDFARARQAFETCLLLSPNNDMVVASSYWLYLTLRRLGDPNEALFILQPIEEKMNILENFSYHQLLLLFKGQRTPEAVLASAGEGELDRATLGYGVGAFYLVNGEREKATALFRQVTAGTLWPAFGFLAAEAELARHR